MDNSKETRNSLTTVARWLGVLSFLCFLSGNVLMIVFGLPEAIISIIILMVLLIALFIYFKKGPRDSPEPRIAAVVFAVLVVIYIPKLLSLIGQAQFQLFANTRTNIIIGTTLGCLVLSIGVVGVLNRMGARA